MTMTFDEEALTADVLEAMSHGGEASCRRLCTLW